MRTFLNIPAAETGQDSILEALLDGVAKTINDYIGVTAINSSYTEYHDGDGSNTLFLRHFPVVTMTSLVIDTSTIAAADYHLYSDEGYIKYDYFTSGDRNVVATFTAGWGAARANVPESIKLALKLWVSYIHKKDNAAFTQRFGEAAVVNVVQYDIPREVRLILEPYRIKRIGAV
jgi:hypothetical protein